MPQPDPAGVGLPPCLPPNPGTEVADACPDEQGVGGG